MTPQYIVGQLRDMIVLKGKTNTQELANSLNISKEKVESLMTQVLSSQQVTIYKFEDALVTESYLDEICLEMYEELQ